MSDQMKQIAQRIKTLREVSDYTVEDVANATELSPEDYEAYESGVVDIPISLLSSGSRKKGRIALASMPK